MRHHGLSLVLGLSASTLACGGTPHDSPDSIVFGAPAILSCPSGSGSAVELGDFGGRNGDLVGCRTSNSISVFVNDGTGSFKTVSAPLSTEGFESYDVNGDGNSDLVWTNQNFDVQISFGKGDGTFQPPVAQPDFPSECSDYVASVDGYANAVCWKNGTATIYDIASDGSKQQVASAPVPSSPKVVDIDGDGKPDFVFTIGSTVAMQRGLGGGAFGATQVVLVATDYVDEVIPEDVDGDGLADLVVATGEQHRDTYFVVRNQAGVLSVANQFSIVDGVSYKFVDATGDGIMDVVLTDKAQLMLLVGKGDGTFEKDALLVTGPWTNASGFTFTDLNDDGKPDLVVGDGSTVSVLLRQ